MTKTLERDLGLPAVVAISMGAMIGSGIFILPAIAYGVAGPSVVLVYIERGLGPLFGTVAGLGTWVSLTFKSALVGGVPS
jgi:amino acid transporter